MTFLTFWDHCRRQNGFFLNLVLGQVSSLCRTGFEIEYSLFILIQILYNLSFVQSFTDHKIFLEKMTIFLCHTFITY